MIAVADTYFYWALAVPAVGIAAFIWDGIFIGATATRGMLLSMAAAAVSFFIFIMGCIPSWQTMPYGLLSSRQAGSFLLGNARRMTSRLKPVCTTPRISR